MGTLQVPPFSNLPRIAASRNQENIHHRDTETRRKTKSKPEGTEVAEVTEARSSGGQRLSGFGS